MSSGEIDGFRLARHQSDPVQDKSDSPPPQPSGECSAPLVGPTERYEYEWADADFFEPDGGAVHTDTGGKSDEGDQWRFNARIERYVLLEVAWGHHQYVEMTAGDIMKAVRGHCLKSAAHSNYNKRVGQLTYRDLKQVFSIGPRPSSLEVRQNCIILSMPPVRSDTIYPESTTGDCIDISRSLRVSRESPN